MKNDIKAYQVTDSKKVYGSVIVFAKNQNRARAIAHSTATLQKVPFISLRATRRPSLDYYHVKGKDYLNPSNLEDRIILAKSSD